MAYAVVIERRVQKHLQTLPPKQRDVLLDAINGLAEDPRPPQAVALHGRKYRGLMKLRVGDYRILYKILDPQAALIIVLTGHRREIYAILERLIG